MMNYCATNKDSRPSKNTIWLLFSVIGLMVVMSSCGINSNLMYKAPTNYQYDSLVKTPTEQYQIAVNDRLKVNFFKKQGEEIFDPADSKNGSQNNVNRQVANGITYTVMPDSTIDLPIIGTMKVVGLTTLECRDTIATLLQNEFVDPFVQVQVVNKRVFVFPGTGGDAKVVPLTNENTTLMEALALAGGIKDRGKARSVRVMRKEGEEWKVFKIDLSKIEGLEQSDMIVQANDYIYVDPSSRIARELLEEVAPIFSIISSSAVVITIVSNIK